MNDIELNKKLINLMESSMSEAAKPDYIDLDKDGDKKEPMKKAAKDKEAKKESKTDEGLESLKSSLRDKMEEVMEAGRYAAPASKGQNPDATTSSMPAKSAPTLGPEQTNGYRGKMVGEEEEVEEEVLDEAEEELDEMAEMLRMAGIEEASIAHDSIAGVTSANNPRASTSSMPSSSTPTKGPEQTNGYRDVLVGEAEDDAEMDDHAEKAGREVAHDMEYDDGHDASDDDHDEKEGGKVTKEIEFDDKEHEAMKSLLKKLLDK